MLYNCIVRGGRFPARQKYERQNSMADDPKDGERRELKVKWANADIPTVYANQLLLSHTGPEFYLIFGEIIAVDDDDPTRVPDVLTVRQRVRVAVSREVMGSFVEAINNNYKNFADKVNAALERQKNNADGN